MEPPNVNNSLFQQLLGSRVEVLLVDAQEHPEKYDACDQLLSVLLRMRLGDKPSDAEKNLLDRSAVLFHQAPEMSKPVQKKPVSIRAKSKKKEAPDLTFGNLPPFWWLKE